MRQLLAFLQLLPSFHPQAPVFDVNLALFSSVGKKGFVVMCHSQRLYKQAARVKRIRLALERRHSLSVAVLSVGASCEAATLSSDTTWQAHTVIASFPPWVDRTLMAL
jgi:hypothetical protein